MAVDYMAKGKISPILYWINKNGHIKLIPTSEILTMERLRRYMTKLGYVLQSAETLHEAELLQKKLQEQLKREQEAELAHDEAMTRAGRQGVRSRLDARMNSASCSEYEREFIRAWLQQREHSHELFKRRFTQQVGHLDALEFDNPEEHVHRLLDRM